MANEVFFLGAGFSRALNDKFPLLKDLNKEILGENLEKLPTWYKHDNLPDYCKDNFEALLTYLYADLPWKTEKQYCLEKALYIEIVEKIHKMFSKFNVWETQDLIKYKALWEYIMKFNIPVITLNYDLIVEKNLNLNKNVNKDINSFIATSNDFCGYYRNLIKPLASSDSDFYNATNYLPEIIKLHGSRNWYFSGDMKDAQIYYCDNETEVEKVLVEPKIPFIIPPLLDKHIFYTNNAIKNLWHRAFYNINRANRIYIIGFSFPLTDLSIKLLFNSAIKDSKEIIVINTEDLSIKNRYNKIFEKCKINYDYCCNNSLYLFMENIIYPKLK